MNVVAKKKFKDKIIEVDDTHFESCSFESCVLVYQGGDFSWTNAQFKNCQVRVLGCAKKTSEFLQNFGLLQKEIKKEQPVSDKVM